MKKALEDAKAGNEAAVCWREMLDMQLVGLFHCIYDIPCVYLIIVCY